LPTGREKSTSSGEDPHSVDLRSDREHLDPLALTLVVFFAYNIEGIRVKGLRGYVKSFIPGGITGAAVAPLFVIEVISNFVGSSRSQYDSSPTSWPATC